MRISETRIIYKLYFKKKKFETANIEVTESFDICCFFRCIEPVSSCEKEQNTCEFNPEKPRRCRGSEVEDFPPFF